MTVRTEDRLGASTGYARRAALAVTVTVALGLGLGAGGCGVSDENALPPDVTDPTSVQTAAGAVAFYRQVNTLFPRAFDPFAVEVGVLTDELAGLPMPVLRGGDYTDLDSRNDLRRIAERHYTRLHTVRNQAREARGFLATYAPDSSVSLQGHMYALEAYAEVFLADLFCSGIPLSTVDFGGDYTVAPGSSTTEVYAHAAGLFDSALALLEDSAGLRHLAAVGRGRALAANGLYAEAAAAVAEVPTDFRYGVVATDDPNTTFVVERPLLQGFAEDIGFRDAMPSVAEQEGGSGPAFRSSGDPRVKAAVLGPDKNGHDFYFPYKYTPDGQTPIAVAEGVEARLIEAEAALQGGGDWLGILNALRTTGTYDLQPNASDPSLTDTLWHAGTGGVAGLRPLEDPGSDAARVDLLFEERAYWLYLTGHRQGDLRRLIRRYPGRSPNTAYPQGSYPGGTGSYVGNYVVPVPEAERDLNPKYTGCVNLNP